MRRIVCLLLLVASPAWAAIGGHHDTLYLAGLSSTATSAPNRTMVAGWVNDPGTDASSKTRGRGRSNTSGTAQGTSFGGPHVSTNTNSNDWENNDFEADAYWWFDVGDSLAKVCMGLVASDTVYLASATIFWNLATKAGSADALRTKWQGPLLIRPRANNTVSGSGSTFGGTAVDSAPSFNRLRVVSGDTLRWRLVNGPGLYDSTSILGTAGSHYDQSIVVGGAPDTVRYELGKFNQGGAGNPVIWSPVGFAQGARCSVVITSIFRTWMVALANDPAKMRSFGFGILGVSVDSGNTSRDSMNTTRSNTTMRYQVHNTLAGNSMGLRLIFNTGLDGFCANKMRNTKQFEAPWWRKAGPLLGLRRDVRVDTSGTNRVYGPEVKKRPPQ